MYTLSEAAKRIGIQVRTARKWVWIGKMNATQDERTHRWYVSAEEVERLRVEYGHKD